ncbi:MAG: SDR family NAD(P)-dependent oxidoreductase [Saprospiraceae bacterium]
MPTALITGANRGIGKEIAWQLGKRGFQVFIGARSEASSREVVADFQQHDIHVGFLAIDVADAASISAAYENLKDQVNKLDVLVNNAGILLDEGAPLLQTSLEDIHKTLAINTIGPLLVTQIFAPLLHSGSRVVNVSSGAGAICGGMGNYAPVYSISKTALNAVTCQLAHALKAKGVVVNAVCPGWVRTDMGGPHASRSVEKGAETPVWLATEAPANLTGKFFRDKKEISW